MKVEITVPTSISEIPLKHYQEFLRLKETSTDEEFIAQKMIETFCGIQIKDVVKMKLSSINELVVHFNKIFSEKPKFKHRFFLGKVEFGFIPDLENITFGEYVDLESYLTKWEDFNKAMAVMYRPITQKVKDKYNIEEYRGANEYAEAMRYAPMDVAISASVFFWTLGKELLEATLSYLKTETMKLQQSKSTSAHEHNLQKTGVGIPVSTDLLWETLHDLMRSLNSDYLNVSPISVLKQKKTKSKI